MNWIEDIFRRYSNPYVKFVIGGTMLSILIFLFPPLYGEGYDTISLLLNGETAADWNTVMNNSFFYGHANLLVVYLVLIILFKVLHRVQQTVEVVVVVFLHQVCSWDVLPVSFSLMYVTSFILATPIFLKRTLR